MSWQKTVEQYSAVSEQEGILHSEILQEAYDQKWFRLFVPQQYGGAGKQLPEILRLEEELATLDGSTAWTVTLCSGAGWFAGFLDKELAKEIFADERVCFAGSGAVGGTAQVSGDGYVINGTWKYASGALHATIFTANCIMKDENGSDILQEDGTALIQSFILKKEEVNILTAWSYIGLVATGSHAFEIKDLWIPANRTFSINENIQVADAGFDYPFLQLAETTLAVNSLGMAQHFLQLAEVVFLNRSGLKRYTKEQVDFFKQTLQQHKEELTVLRNSFYTAFEKSWNSLMNDKIIPMEILEEVSTQSRQLAHTSLRAVDATFPYCGLEAAKKESDINRVWRDIHTASQHALFTF